MKTKGLDGYLQISDADPHPQTAEIIKNINVDKIKNINIRDAKTPKDAWGNLKKIFATSTTTRKLQLKQELSNL